MLDWLAIWGVTQVTTGLIFKPILGSFTFSLFSSIVIMFSYGKSCNIPS